jgi:type I restriction enzyme S subunit
METMQSEKVKKLVPELRFKGFEDEWILKKLAEVADIIGGGTPDTTIKEYWNGEIQWFTPTEIKSDYVSNSFRTITELGLNKSSAKKLPIGTILLTTRATIGEVSIALKECSTNQGFQSLIARSGNNNVFLFYWIKENKYELTSRANGSTFPEISKTAIEKISLNIPSIPEQQKIASFLSSVDAKIQQLSRKKELLENYKKGAMQQLFSGKLRFKDENGKEYADWEEKRLGDFVLSYKGGAPLTPSDFTKEPGCEVIPKKGIAIGGRLVIDNETPTYCKQAFYEAYSKSIIDNSYLITTLRDLVPSGPSIGYIVQFNSKNKYILAQGVYGLKIDENKLNREWVIQFSNTIEYRKIMQTIMVGSTQVHIRNEEFFKVELKLPSIKEQQKIANFLSSIDSKIESTTQQIIQTQTFKKGLLQKMFVAA